MARPTMLDSELIATIERLIDTGMTVKAICGAINITETTFYRWMQQGEDPNNTGDIYREFSQAVKRGRAALQARWLSRIEDAAADPKTWTAAAWLLERSFPQDFGRRTQVDVTVNEGTIAEIERLAIELGVAQPEIELLEEEND